MITGFACDGGGDTMPDMLELSRLVRFCINPMVDLDMSREAPRNNTFAAWPSMAGIGIFYELEVTCRGQPDAGSGYVAGIGQIDAVVRDRGVPIIDRVIRERQNLDPGVVLAEICEAITDGLAAGSSGDVVSVSWHLSPYYWLTMESAEPSRVRLTQRFEFAAAHRLHRDDLTDAENRTVFGRCNNPNGHGHNYQVEVVASRSIPAAEPTGLSLPALEQIVHDHVIKDLDHAHLNLDVPDFDGINPTVEQIVSVCFKRLEQPIEAVGGRLEEVTVWETAKTSCTVRRNPTAAAEGATLSDFPSSP